MKTPLAIACAMLIAVALARVMTPDEEMVGAGEFRYADIIPRSFGDWQAIPNPLAQVDLAVKRDEQDQASLLYDEVLSRSYRSSRGEVVMLSIAYGRRQRQELKIHRPELCYASQGFALSGLQEDDVLRSASSSDAFGRSMLAVAPNRIEPVLYWIRIGEDIPDSAWSTRLLILKSGLAGKVPDGVLVRTSQVIDDVDGYRRSIETQKRFAGDLLDSLGSAERRRLIPERFAGART